MEFSKIMMPYYSIMSSHCVVSRGHVQWKHVWYQSHTHTHTHMHTQWHMHTHSRTLWHMYTHPNTAQITGYNAYLGFLYLDYTYNNAVVHTFVNLLSGYKTKPVSMLSFDNLQKDHSLGKLSLCAVWDSEVLWLRRACMPICLSKSSNLDNFDSSDLWFQSPSFNYNEESDQ